jgi:hypothetical protein
MKKELIMNGRLIFVLFRKRRLLAKSKPRGFFLSLTAEIKRSGTEDVLQGTEEIILDRYSAQEFQGVS